MALSTIRIVGALAFAAVIVSGTTPAAWAKPGFAIVSLSPAAFVSNCQSMGGTSSSAPGGGIRCTLASGLSVDARSAAKIGEVADGRCAARQPRPRQHQQTAEGDSRAERAQHRQLVRNPLRTSRSPPLVMPRLGLGIHEFRRARPYSCSQTRGPPLIQEWAKPWGDGVWVWLSRFRSRTDTARHTRRYS
jgi:hypothetical protein